ncbi:MAG TPA: phytanoyl-CoA dioxygenase family protein [Pirellulales bacterium]
MVHDALRSQFERDGFVIVRSFLDAADLAELNHQLARYIREVVPRQDGSHAFYLDASRPETLKQLHRMSVDPFFEQYRRHPLWQTLAEGLLGEAAEADDPEWFNKPAASNHPTPPHQDNYYFCLQPCQVATIWLALDRVDEGNGCLRYVPGSHLRGVREHSVTSVLGFSQGISDYSQADRRLEVPILLEPGDAVVHHGNAIHRANGNPSPDRDRRAFAMVYRGVSCRRDEAAYARYRAAFEQQHQQVAASASGK